MIIHTPASRRRVVRQANRRRKRALEAQQVLTKMRAGAKLLVTYGRRCPVWTLSPGGELVPNAVAVFVIEHPNIEGEGGGLFHDLHTHQSYRHRYVEK